MPQIKDNLITGNNIKNALHEKNITVDSLALYLKMSKTALNQVLEGNNILDQSKLKIVAEYLEIPLENLIFFDDTIKFESTFSHYAKKGLDGIKEIINRNDLGKIDINGRFLVEYFMDLNDVKSITCLVNEFNEAFTNLHLNHQVYVRFICFLLENNIDKSLMFIEDYANYRPGFYIEDKEYERRIFTAIDKLNREEIYDYFYNGLINVKKIILWKFKIGKTINPLSKREVIHLIGKYSLNNMLEYFLPKIKDFKYSLYSFIQNKYLRGVQFVLENYENKDLLFKENMHEYFTLSILSKDLDILKYLVENKYSFNLQKLLIMALNEDFPSGYNYLTDKFENELYYREIVCVTSKLGNLEYLKKITNKLTNDELDLALSMANETDIPYIKYLLEVNARFKDEYYNSAYCVKMNNLYEHFKEEK